MNPNLSDPAFWHRIQFGFTVTYHYLFPQLTMGLAWFIVIWKWMALRTGDERYAQACAILGKNLRPQFQRRRERNIEPQTARTPREAGSGTAYSTK